MQLLPVCLTKARMLGRDQGIESVPWSSPSGHPPPFPPCPTQARLLGHDQGIESVPWSSLSRDRALCDVCATSLHNLHMHCGACGWDVCTACVQRARSHAAPAPASQPPRLCVNPGCSFSAALAARQLHLPPAQWPVQARRFFEVGG
eukprot:280376-Chlamydomonas_euryale.AAC.4